jgi:hypothetical protein
MRFSFVLPLVTLLLSPGFACNKEPVPGDACKPTEIRCVNPTTELACQKGVFMAAPCKGPLGCREDGKHLVCDFSGNAEGDPCSLDEEGSAKCIGDKERITCRAGKYVIDACRGDEGCRAGSGVKCDQSKGQVGDACHGATNACNVEGRSVLVCNAGKLQISALCPGEGGCTIVNHQVDCDLGKKDDPAGPTAKKAH